MPFLAISLADEIAALRAQDSPVTLHGQSASEVVALARRRPPRCLMSRWLA